MYNSISFIQVFIRVLRYIDCFGTQMILRGSLGNIWVVDSEIRI